MLTRVPLLVALLPAVAGAWRTQPAFVADRWSGVHAAGGALLYALPRLAGSPPADAAAFSAGLGVAWEVLDGCKGGRPVFHDWRDLVWTSDGFCWSDLAYHGAGLYCAWLVDAGFLEADRLAVLPLAGGGAAVEIGWAF